jgi:hypothetical protein
MNRIVLIGNGFDLAHGLKTSYADFINWYWEQWMNKILFSLYGLDESDGLCSIRITNYHIPKNTYLNGLDYINALLSTYILMKDNYKADTYVRNETVNNIIEELDEFDQIDEIDTEE